jgi:UDP-glucose 4-epimerase
VLDNGVTGSFDRLDGLAGPLEVVRGDIRDTVEVARAMAGVAGVFHQAAEVSVPRSVADPIGTYAVNVTGTLNVLEAARAAGVRRVVMASTSAIYGDDPEMPKRETMAPRPISPYAASKLADEGLCAVYARCYGLETVALRYFNVYGPGQDPSSAYAAVIPKMVDLVRQGRSPVIYGDGEQTRDFVFVGDVVDANLLAMSSPLASGGVFNVASGSGISLNRMLDLIGTVFGSELVAEYLPERAGDIRHSLADVSAAADRLGFRASTPFADGLRRTVEAGLTGGTVAAAEMVGVG